MRDYEQRNKNKNEKMEAIEALLPMDEMEDIASPSQLEELEQELEHYLVKYPNEQQIDATIDHLRPYVPLHQKKALLDVERFIQLAKHSLSEISFISKSYWMISCILFIVGYLLTFTSQHISLITIFILSPILFIVGLLEVFKSRDQGLLEIEMSCKFSLYEILLSRLFLIGLYNMSLTGILILAIAPLIDVYQWWSLLFAWFIPFTIFVAISLWLSMRLRGAAFLTTILSLFGLFCLFLASQISLVEAFLELHLVFYLICSGIGIALILFQMKQMVKKYSSYEGNEVYEASH